MPTLDEENRTIIAAATRITQRAQEAIEAVVVERDRAVKLERDFAVYKLAHPAGTPTVPVEPVPQPVPGNMPAVERNGTRTPTPPNLSAQSGSLGMMEVRDGQTINFDGKLLSGLTVGALATARNFRLKSDASLKYGNDATIEDFRIQDGSKCGIEGYGRLTIRRGIIGEVSQHSLIVGDCLWLKVEDLQVGSSLYQSTLRWARTDGYFLRVQVRAPKTKSTARGGTLDKGIWFIDCDIEGAGTYGAGNPLGQRDGGDGRGVKEFNIKGGGVKYAAGDLWLAAYDKVKASGNRSREEQVAIAAEHLFIRNVDVPKTLAVRDALLTEFGNAYHVNTRIKVPLIAIEAGGMMDFDVRPESKIAFSRENYPEWKLNGDPMRRKPVLKVAGQAVTP